MSKRTLKVEIEVEASGDSNDLLGEMVADALNDLTKVKLFRRGSFKPGVIFEAVNGVSIKVDYKNDFSD